jgi:Fe-S cluster biogenesis protein NfuA/nitrite reductase/ring-hydroxylating ferredoxin subunit
MSVVDPTLSQRSDLAGFISDIERIEEIFETWDETPRGVAQAYRGAIEALHGEAFRRLVRALKLQPAAFAAMRDAATDEVVYAVLRRHGILKPSVNERVEAALDGVRPMLASHGGDVELVKVAPPVVEVRFLGACDGCPASMLTFHAGVKKAVQAACPEITEILQIKGQRGSGEGVRFVSPFAVAAEGNWISAGTLNDLPEGVIRPVELDGEAVLLYRQGSIVTCFQDSCAHLGLPLGWGEVADGVITCPHHGFRYDLVTGECLTAPEVQLQQHAVRVVGRNVEVRLAR